MPGGLGGKVTLPPPLGSPPPEPLGSSGPGKGGVGLSEEPGSGSSGWLGGPGARCLQGK